MFVPSNMFLPLDVQVEVHRKVFKCVSRIFPTAIKTFNDAPQHMKDLWFNEYKKKHWWEPNDESVVRRIFEKKAGDRLSDTLGYARNKLRKGKPRPSWMSDQVLAQYHVIWDNPQFKKTSEKNKKNRNSDCGGMGSSKNTGGSIPTYSHRMRMEKEDGVERSRVLVYTNTHTRKSDGSFVCPKSKAVIDTVNHLSQTQPEKEDVSVWLEAADCVHKGGKVYGFGSDSRHYFSEAVRQKSKFQESSLHTSCQEQIRRLMEENVEVREVLQKMEAMFAQLSANQNCPNPNGHTQSNQDSDVGLDDVNTNEGAHSTSDSNDANSEE